MSQLTENNTNVFLQMMKLACLGDGLNTKQENTMLNMEITKYLVMTVLYKKFMKIKLGKE